MTLSPAHRDVARQVAGWTAAVFLGSAGLVWMAGAVESARHGLLAALLGAALTVPGVLVPLSPLLTALGAALAAARMEARGERAALEACGLSPWRSGRSAAAVGLAVGALVWALSAGGLAPLEQASTALRGGRPAAPWLWVDGEAVRTADGARVRLAEDGLVLRPGDGDGPSEEALALAHMRASPRTANAAALAGLDWPPVVVERQSRWARVFSAAALAMAAWLPLGRSATAQIGAALGLGLAWQMADLLLQALASQGQLSPTVGAWGAAAGVGAWLLARALRA